MKNMWENYNQDNTSANAKAMAFAFNTVAISGAMNDETLVKNAGSLFKAMTGEDKLTLKNSDDETLLRLTLIQVAARMDGGAEFAQWPNYGEREVGHGTELFDRLASQMFTGGQQGQKKSRAEACSI